MCVDVGMHVAWCMYGGQRTTFRVDSAFTVWIPGQKSCGHVWQQVFTSRTSSLAHIIFLAVKEKMFINFFNWHLFLNYFKKAVLGLEKSDKGIVENPGLPWEPGPSIHHKRWTKTVHCWTRVFSGRCFACIPGSEPGQHIPSAHCVSPMPQAVTVSESVLLYDDLNGFGWALARDCVFPFGCVWCLAHG